MADAWETLLSGSTIPSGDAWEHLNAQGGGGTTETVLFDGMYITLSNLIYEVIMESEDFTVEVQEYMFTVEVSESTYIIEVLYE